MKLNLYNKCNGNIDTIFKWEPFEKQWWITGFNPEYEPVVENQVMIGTLDLSEHEDMYNKLKTSYYDDDKETNDANLFFDDEDSLVWIQWNEENLR